MYPLSLCLVLSSKRFHIESNSSIQLDYKIEEIASNLSNDKNSSVYMKRRKHSLFPLVDPVVFEKPFEKHNSNNLRFSITVLQNRWIFRGKRRFDRGNPFVSPPRFVNRRDKSSCSVFFRRRGSLPRREKETRIVKTTPVTLECFPLGLKRILGIRPLEK